MARIEATGLTKRYGSKLAVDQLSFTVEPGVVTGFLGPNGAGKSTTMRLMLGLDHGPGETTFDGKHYRELHHPMRHVGAVLEAKAFHPTRTARNHLAMLAAAGGIPRQRVDEVLEYVGLTDVARRRPKTFSLGMGQRLGLACALLGDPHTLILDEPANGLDPQGITWLRSFLKSYAADGKTVFVSSHLLAEMALMADRLVVIGLGRLIASGSVDEFVRSVSSTSVLVRTPQPEQLLDALPAVDAEVAPQPDGALRGHRTRPGQGGRAGVLRRRRPARAHHPHGDAGGGVPRGHRQRAGVRRLARRCTRRATRRTTGGPAAMPGPEPVGSPVSGGQARTARPYPRRQERKAADDRRTSVRVDPHPDAPLHVLAHRSRPAAVGSGRRNHRLGHAGRPDRRGGGRDHPDRRKRVQSAAVHRRVHGDPRGLRVRTRVPPRHDPRHVGRRAQARRRGVRQVPGDRDLVPRGRPRRASA